MTGTKDSATVSDINSDKDKRTRVVSSIEFPYGDLEDGISIAAAIYNNAGTECSIDQLAGFTQSSSNSGSFRSKISTARIFGLVETERGKVTLTSLGQDIIDNSKRAKASVTAFYNVPLYFKIYEHFKGRMIPPAAGLEREMENFGVSPKQKDRARQAFERSAEQAGFFQHGKDRLIEPITGRKDKKDHEDAEKFNQKPDQKPDAGNGGSNTGSGGGGGGGESKLHPFIQGLLQTLPEQGKNWSKKDRKKWLDTASGIFDLIYKDSEDEANLSNMMD